MVPVLCSLRDSSWLLSVRELCTLCQGQLLFQALNANLAPFTRSLFTTINSPSAECDGPVGLGTVWAWPCWKGLVWAGLVRAGLPLPLPARWTFLPSFPC